MSRALRPVRAGQRACAGLASVVAASCLAASGARGADIVTCQVSDYSISLDLELKVEDVGVLQAGDHWAGLGEAVAEEQLHVGQD